MKFLIKHKHKISVATLVFTLAIYAILSSMNIYIKLFIILKYLSLFIFVGYLGILIINFLRNLLITDILYPTRTNVTIVNVIAIAATIAILFTTSTNQITAAKEEQIIRSHCTLYDSQRNKIYEPIIHYTCPTVEVIENTPTHLQLSGHNTLQASYDMKTLDAFYVTSTNIIDLTDATIINKELYDIDITYYDNGMIKFYQVWQTETREIIKDGISQYRYYSTYAWVKNDFVSNGIISTRDSQFYEETITNELSVSFTEHYDFDKPNFTTPKTKIETSSTTFEERQTMNITVSEYHIDGYDVISESVGYQKNEHDVYFEVPIYENDIRMIDYTVDITNYDKPNESRVYEVFSYIPVQSWRSLLIYDETEYSESNAIITETDSNYAFGNGVEIFKWFNFNETIYFDENEINVTEYGYITANLEKNRDYKISGYLSNVQEYISRDRYRPYRVDSLLHYEEHPEFSIIRENNIFYEYIINYSKTLE